MEKNSDSDSDTEEFKRLKKMKEVQNMKVDGDGFVQGPVADSSNFEYDPVTRMYKKKDGLVELETRRMDKKDEKEETKEKEKVEIDKEELMNELAREIEELENEVDSQEEEGSKIDWGESAINSIIKEKEKEAKKTEKQQKLEEKRKRLEEEKGKKSKKLQDGEVSDGIEDGEVSSGDDKKRSKLVRKRKTRSRSRSRRRSYSRGRDKYSHSKSSRRRSRSYSRDKHHTSRRSSRSPYGRERYSRKRYSRSRSRSRGRDREKEAEDRYNRMKRRQEKHQRSKINKEKLLEIAKKNANKILKAGGDFMGMNQDRLISMKAGGSNLDELTKFCKLLAKKGLEDGERIELLAESDSDSEEEFHHPFMVKDRPLPNPITMLIGEPKETLTPTARAVAKSQRMLEFPVSSGNAHRTKEGDKLPAVEAPEDPLGEWQPAARPALEMAPDDEEEMIKFHEQMEQEEKELRESASQTLWTLNEEDKNILERKGKQYFETEDKADMDDQALAEIEKLKPKPSELAEVLSKASAPLALPAPAPAPVPLLGDVSE